MVPKLMHRHRKCHISMHPPEQVVLRLEMPHDPANPHKAFLIRKRLFATITNRLTADAVPIAP